MCCWVTPGLVHQIMLCRLFPWASQHLCGGQGHASSSHSRVLYAQHNILLQNHVGEESQGAYLHRSTAVSALPKKQDPAQPPPASWLLKIRDFGGRHKGVCSPIFISPSLKADFCKIK